jgi:TatD DNase family protein
MSLFDTHARLADPRFLPVELPDLTARARMAGVASILVVGVSLEASRRAIQLAERLAPEWDAWASVGVHPAAAGSINEETITALHRMGQARRVRALAAGLDLSPAAPPRRVQEAALEALLQLSQWLDLPVALHDGGNAGPLIARLHAHQELFSASWVHDFNGTPEALEAYLALGLSVAVSGRVTDRREGAGIRDLLPDIPLDHLLIETDAPAHPRSRTTERPTAASPRSFLTC